jgi:hypothetical protein
MAVGDEGAGLIAVRRRVQIAVDLELEIDRTREAKLDRRVAGLKGLRPEARIIGVGIGDKVAFDLEMAGVDRKRIENFGWALRREGAHCVGRRRIEQAVHAFVGRGRIIGERYRSRERERPAITIKAPIFSATTLGPGDVFAPQRAGANRT